MLFYIALTLVPALAAFCFQLICYASYQERSSSSASQTWQQREALQNA